MQFRRRAAPRCAGLDVNRTAGEMRMARERREQHEHRRAVQPRMKTDGHGCQAQGYHHGSAPAMRPGQSTAGRNTACGLTTPTRGFTAVVSVFRGTPPIKPIKMCAVRSFRLAGFPAD